mgnify:CR=1 FL=1
MPMPRQQEREGLVASVSHSRGGFLIMTDKERDELIDNYAWRCVDDMDIKDLCRAMAEQIAASFDTESDDYLIEQVKEYYPDLLE